MKTKTIKKIINRVFLNWKNSLETEELKQLAVDNTIVTGGSIVSLFLNEEVNDFDFYFRTKEAAKTFAEYYTEQFKKNNENYRFKSGNKLVDIEVVDDKGRIKIVVKSAGVASETKTDEYQYFEGLEPGSVEQEEFIEEAMYAVERKKSAKKGEYKPVFLTSNAISLSNDIQIIIRFYGEPDEIHKNYDFVHCTNYWTSWDKDLILKQKALEAILTKELIYTGSLYPLCSLFRIRKFIQRGWTINAGQILKIAFQVNALDLTNPLVLEDQLIGVDIAYFRDLLFRIKQDGKQESIDEIYISRLIDEIF